MGKLKKKDKTTDDEKQSKISSFFQAGAREQSSGLFTQLGKPGTTSRLSLKKSNSKSDVSKSGDPSGDTSKSHGISSASLPGSCCIDLTDSPGNGDQNKSGLRLPHVGDDKSVNTSRRTAETLGNKNDISTCSGQDKDPALLNSNVDTDQPGNFFFSTEHSGKHHVTSATETVYTKNSKLSFVGRCDGQVVSNFDQENCPQTRSEPSIALSKPESSYTGNTRLSFVGRCNGRSSESVNDPDIIPETQNLPSNGSKNKDLIKNGKIGTCTSGRVTDNKSISSVGGKQLSSKGSKTSANSTVDSKSMKTVPGKVTVKVPNLPKGGNSVETPSKGTKGLSKGENTVTSKGDKLATPSSKGYSELDSSQIIPDTPEDPLVEANKKRKVLIGRSFLTSSSAVANPAGLIMRPAVDKNQKRKITQARKSLIDVSVCFNQSKTEEWKENSGSSSDSVSVKNSTITGNVDDVEEVKDDDDDNDDDDVDSGALVEMMEAQAEIENKDKDIDWGVISKDNIGLPTSSTEQKQIEVHDTCTNIEPSNELCNNMQIEPDTPTKVYDSDVPSLKRMSKSGLSPCAKKSNSSPISGEDGKNLKFLSSDKRENVEKVKCNLSSSLKKQDKKASKKVLSVTEENKAEEGDTKEKEDGCSFVGSFSYKAIMTKSRESRIKAGSRGSKVKNEKTSIDLEGDDVLADILQELNPVSKAGHNEEFVLLKSADHDLEDNAEKNSSKSMLASPQFSSKKFRVKKAKGRQSDVQKSESQRGLTSNQISFTLTEEEIRYFDELDKNIHSSSVKAKSQELEQLGEVTHVLDTNDANYPTYNFKSAKLCKNISKPKVYDKSVGKGFAINSQSKEVIKELDNLDDQMEIERCVTPDPVVKATQNIGEFSTQPEPLGVGVDGNIGAFPTQSESQDLCEDFEQLSPFKKGLFEDSFSVEDEMCEKPACEKFGRHVVKGVIPSDDRSMVTLDLEDALDNTPRTCVLHGFWTDTHISEGDVVHVLADFDNRQICHIGDNAGLLVVNPDLLLSGTTVVSSVFCMRKSVLKEKFKGCDSKNVQMLYGSIIHSIFQQVLQKKITDKEEILQVTQSVLTQFLHEIYINDVTEGQVMEEVKQYIPQLQKWTDQYTCTGSTQNSKSKKSEDLIITDIKDIEENIWSPRFGVKGMIDLTVEVQIQKPRKRMCTVPLELKTGRASYSLEHKGQVTLYSMMSSDRRDDPNQGLLLYLKEPSMQTIAVDHLNKRGLIQLRNEMAYYISRQVRRSHEDGRTTYTFGSLPQPINNPRACSKCPLLFNCSAHLRIEERPLGAGHALTSLSQSALEHVSPSHLEYYTNWCLMLDLENQTSLKNGTRKIWCETGKQRESIGECISGLMVSGQNVDSGPEIDAENDFCVLKFTTHPLVHRPDGRGLDTVGLSVGDYVIVSCEKPSLIAVCTGTIQSLTHSSVHLVTESESLQRLLRIQEGYFRLDKYDGYSTAGMLYSNVSRLMGDDPHSTKLRSLIVDRTTPKFLSKLSKSQIEKVKNLLKPLNKPQKMVILKVLMSEDYVLVKGYPGTGKTSTIVALVQVCRILGLSVLLTSYTHSAVDNILLKLLQNDVSFIRLGRLNKIHDKIKKYAAEVLTRKFKTVADLRDFYNQQGVIATSCLGVNHPVFTQRKFDVCIVDEASQVLQPACLGPLFCAQKFVLVGDPKQLPPVVQSKEARELGMDESLFQHLDDNGATFELNLQYRMNRDIMWLSNQLVYDGALQCGSDSIADAKLQYTNSAALLEVTSRYKWMNEIFREDRAAIFLNTQQVPALESRDKAGLISNTVEASIVCLLVEALTAGGVRSENIGIIAPYRNQVTVIKSILKQEVEVNTVDQYQGRDKDVIIISFTRSFKSSLGTDNKSGQLLKDIRRLNVAITRAKTKLMMLGNRETLMNYPPLKTIICNMENKEQNQLTIKPDEVTWILRDEVWII